MKNLSIGKLCILILMLSFSCTSTDENLENKEIKNSIELDTLNYSEDNFNKGVNESKAVQSYETPILIVYKEGTSEGEKEEFREEHRENPYVMFLYAEPCPDDEDKEVWKCNVPEKMAIRNPAGSQQSTVPSPIPKSGSSPASHVIPLQYCDYEITEEDYEDEQE